MKLQIGSGYMATPGFYRTDINPACPDLDYVGSADTLPADWSDRFDEVQAVDVLEHFSWQDTERVLVEWRRVMAPGGRIYIQVPDGFRIAKAGVEGRLGYPDEVPGDAHPHLLLSFWLLGAHCDGSRAKTGDDWRWNAHYTVFSPELLRWHLERAGFEVESMEALALNIACWARKPE